MLKKLFAKALSAYRYSDLDLQLKARFFLVLCLVIFFIMLFLDIGITIIQYLTLKHLIISSILLLIGGMASVLTVLVLLVCGYFFLASHLLVLIVMLLTWSVMIFDPSVPLARLDTFVFIICLLGLLPLVINQRKSVIFLYGALNIGFLLGFIIFFRPELMLSDYELFEFLCDNSLAIITACFVAAGVFGINNAAIKRAKAEIQERRQAEEQRLKLEAQLHQAQKMEAIGQLAGGVAHDFNNMLSVVIGNTELVLMQQELDNDGREQLEAIRYTVNRSAALIRQLLAFARRQTIVPEMIDINQAISEMMPMLQQLISENIILKWLPGQITERILIDPSQIDQILTNLIVNARDAIDKNGNITVETEAIILDKSFGVGLEAAVSGHYIMLAVSDSGCGMDRETQDQIFDPFFSTKKGMGTGLGLATIYGIIKQNSGLIKVYSEPGRGTSFKLFFPAIETRDVVSERKTKQPDFLPKGTETILMVEDDQAILKFGTTVLEQLGYTVMAEDNPAKALELVQSGCDEIDLLLTDIVMPGMSGHELAQQIRESIPCIRCLYISGYTANAITNGDLSREGIIFLAKPFSLKELAEKVREALL